MGRSGGERREGYDGLWDMGERRGERRGGIRGEWEMIGSESGVSYSLVARMGVCLPVVLCEPPTVESRNNSHRLSDMLRMPGTQSDCHPAS